MSSASVILPHLSDYNFLSSHWHLFLLKHSLEIKYLQLFAVCCLIFLAHGFPLSSRIFYQVHPVNVKSKLLRKMDSSLILIAKVEDISGNKN